MVGIGIEPSPSFWTWQPDAISGVVFRETVKLKFKAAGDPAKKYLQASGTYFDKAYWYYEPNINAKTGKGQIVFEITNDNKASFGLETQSDTLGLIINFLTKDDRIIYSLDARVTTGQPGYALVYPVNEKPEVIGEAATTILRPYILHLPVGENWQLVVKGTF